MPIRLPPEWEIELERLRKEQRRAPASEPMPLYLPLDLPSIPEEKPKPDNEDENQPSGVWEVDLGPPSGGVET